MSWQKERLRRKRRSIRVERLVNRDAKYLEAESLGLKFCVDFAFNKPIEDIRRTGWVRDIAVMVSKKTAN